jgi:uncharacterized protein
MHYLLFYEAADDYVARRAKFRSEHLAKAWKASQRGDLVLAGAYANPVDGAVLLFKGESPSVAEEFAKADPYVTGGAVKRWYVREWTTVVGDDAASPVKPEQTASGAPQPTGRNKDGVAPIVRLWRGRSSAEKAGDYVRHATRKVFPQLDSIEGHQGAYLLRRSLGDATEFLVLTFWDSMEAVRRFAGSQPTKAVVEPAARAALTDFDEVATHYEILSRTGR